MKIIVDIQHGGAPGTIGKTGATDGTVVERALTSCYGTVAALRLVEAGHHVQVYPQRLQAYEDRWEEARRWGAQAYIACHVNGGMGEYGAAFYRSAMDDDRMMATAVVSRLKVLPDIGSAKTIAARRELKPGEVASNRSPKEHWTVEALRCIEKAPCAAICFEPFFITAKGHQQFKTVQGLTQVGEALASGVDAFLRGRA